MPRSATLCAGAIALTLAGCGGSPKSANAPATPTNVRMVLLHSNGGGPTAIEVQAPPAVRAAGGRRLAEFRLGRAIAAQSGCLACHKIGGNGNRGPGPNLTRIGEKLSPARIEHALRRPIAPMPSFRNLPPAKFKAVVTFLSLLRR
jgi:ubiquinol-cytochrome c reductase cytochrome b subunit/menaquinol-cytochrome c reductase cytochrome b/c subunit